jgi:hypothetical protein
MKYIKKYENYKDDNFLFYWRDDRVHKGDFGGLYNEIELIAIHTLLDITSIIEDFGERDDISDLIIPDEPKYDSWNEFAKTVILENYRTEIMADYKQRKLSIDSEKWTEIEYDNTHNYPKDAQLRDAEMVAKAVTEQVDFNAAVRFFWSFIEQFNRYESIEKSIKLSIK